MSSDIVNAGATAANSSNGFHIGGTRAGRNHGARIYETADAAASKAAYQGVAITQTNSRDYSDCTSSRESSASRIGGSGSNS